MKLYSPAKLNLFFRVLKKRDDGFHEIASLVQAISLCDTMHFEQAKKDSLTCTDPSIPTDQRNFIHKARELFREKTGYLSPFSIHVEKKIPTEGGFGGGSGNIATTLYAMNLLSRLAIDLKTLTRWAGEISSDAPFFFSKGTAYTTGRGEILEEIAPFPSTSLVLAKPHGEGLSTPLVYRQCTPNAHPISPRKMIAKQYWGINDLEVPAFALRPDLRAFKTSLQELGFDAVGMTGSGSGFFCFGDVKDPSLPNATFWKGSFLSRAEGEWYALS